MRVHQIYFKEEQKERIEAEFYPTLNEKCDVFFENSVIRDLILRDEHKMSDADYFGVVSYKLREKLGFTKENWKNNKNIANVSTQDFTVEQFKQQLYQGNPDAMSFQRHVPHDCVSVADGFHPGFKNFWTIILNKIGMRWEPTSYENVFYCQFFVAKSELYDRYVKEMLIPAMDVMKAMPELYMNSSYPYALPADLQEAWGIKHYTFHAFLCERFFTHFAHIHNLKCLHY